MNDSAALAGELRVLLGKLKRRLREQANAGDLTPSQIAALVRLERDGPLTVTVLAAREGVRPQSMGATVDALEAAGLVVATADPKDGRKAILSLTDACREMILAGRAAREDWLSRTIQAQLDPQERERLADALRLLHRIADT